MTSETNQTKVRPTKSKIWLKRGLYVMFFIILLMGVRAWQQRHILTGANVPLSGTLLDGKPYVLASKLGQPVLVHFWATWCPTCKAEQATIDALARESSNVITVSMWSDRSELVQKYMHEQGLSFPVINDPDGTISTKWNVYAVPASFIINADGKIRFVKVGYAADWELRFRLWLAGW